MDKIDLDELEKVLKLRAAFDYGTQPIEFLWGYDRTLIESVPGLIARVRELERENAGLEARIRYLTEERDTLEWELNDIKRAIDD